MNTEELLDSLFSLLEQRCGTIAVKDFTGFLNREQTLGTALLPYTGHHAPFCAAVKQHPACYARCVRCSRVHEDLCKRAFGPFVKPCFLGLSEYAVPIFSGGQCVGSLSAGLWCADPAASEKKIRAMAERFGRDPAELLALLAELPRQAPFSEGDRGAADFVATLIAGGLGPVPERPSTRPDTGFETILTYIRNHYTDPGLNVNAIAKACNYSPSYVSHAFSRRMKRNLRTYVNQLRLILAKRLLQGGSSVARTAMVCGYTDVNYFAAVFRRTVGVAPSRYARNAAKAEKI